MAQLKPGFITGANAKIKAFDKTIAYCSDVSYNVTVQTIPVESMGKYEVHSNEPVGYTVDGTFSVIRYTKNATDAAAGGVIKDAADGKNNAPESIENGSQGHMGQHLDPKQLLISQTFNLEIIERRGEAGANETSVFKIKDCRLTRRGMTLNKRGVMVDNYAYVGILATDEDIVAEVSESGVEDLS
jgi:hypothetical protein